MTKQTDALVEKQTRFRKRCEALEEAYTRRTIAELRKIRPDLPESRIALHYAHNWLVCRGDRRAKWLLDQLYKKQARLSQLSNAHWERIYKKVYH